MVSCSVPVTTREADCFPIMTHAFQCLFLFNHSNLTMITLFYLRKHHVIKQVRSCSHLRYSSTSLLCIVNGGRCITHNGSKQESQDGGDLHGRHVMCNGRYGEILCVWGDVYFTFDGRSLQCQRWGEAGKESFMMDMFLCFVLSL